MRADRLVSRMLLLQSRQRLTAEDIAWRLQVSVRTIYRDLDALSSSDWRTTLTGLTGAEIQALAAVGAPGALEDIGLSEALQSGLIKLAAALPAAQQPAAEHARQRLHVDGSSWFQEKEVVPQLAILRDAVWHDRRVRLAYRDVEGTASERVVDPYGLVIKAERWYLVAVTDDQAVCWTGKRAMMTATRAPILRSVERVSGARGLEEVARDCLPGRALAVGAGVS